MEQTKPTTRAEEIAGPYKVAEKADGGFYCEGPTKTEWTYSEEKSAEAEATTEPYYLTNDLRARLTKLMTNP